MRGLDKQICSGDGGGDGYGYGDGYSNGSGDGSGYGYGGGYPTTNKHYSLLEINALMAAYEISPVAAASLDLLF